MKALSSVAARVGRLPFPLAKPTWPQGVARDNPERRVGLAYDHDWSRRYPVRVARAVVIDNVTRPLSRVVAPATVRGAEHLRHVEPPVIFVANHTSHVDTPLLLANLPVWFRHHTVVAAAADYFFDKTWKAAMWSFLLPAIPIERTRVNRQSADVAADLLAEGWNLVIFPEGGRSPDGWAQPFLPGGAAYLARRTGCSVVPVHLYGARHVLPKRQGKDGQPKGGSGTEACGGATLRRASVTITFGAPLTPEEDEGARPFGVRVEQAVAVLADEVGSDWWQARRHLASGTTPSPRGPDRSPWLRAWALDPPSGDGAAQREPRWPR